MNNEFLVLSAIVLTGGVIYMNKKAKASGGGSDPAIIEPINGGGSGTGGGGIGYNQPSSPDVVPDPVIVADPISGGGSGYTAPVWQPPDNEIIEDIDIPTASGGIVISDTAIVITGGGMGGVQTFKAGTVAYDCLATYYRAKDSGLVVANQSYTEQAVTNFYLAVERFGTDNAVKNMSKTQAANWKAVSAYCPFTYLPIAESKYMATVTTGGTQRKAILNNNNGLAVDCLYTFDIPLHAGDTINFQTSAAGNVVLLRAVELSGGVA